MLSLFTVAKGAEESLLQNGEGTVRGCVFSPLKIAGGRQGSTGGMGCAEKRDAMFHLHCSEKMGAACALCPSHLFSIVVWGGTVV